MNNLKIKRIKRQFRARRVRAKLTGTFDRPRLSVFRSNKHIYGQLINDTKGETLISASDLDLQKTGSKNKTALARMVGAALAKKTAELKITKVVFDKGSYKYHGIIKAVAEGAREGGLEF